MKTKNALFKLATVVSSVVLLSGFVCYRAGAFNWLMKPSIPPADTQLSDMEMMSSSKSMILPGSKSMTTFVGLEYLLADGTNIVTAELLPPPSEHPLASPEKPTTPAPSPAPPVILPGSKNDRILIVPLPSAPPPPPPSQQAVPPAPEFPPVILPSSKGGIFLPPASKPVAKPVAPAQQAAPAPTQPPPVLLPGPKSAEVFTPSTKPVSRP